MARRTGDQRFPDERTLAPPMDKRERATEEMLDAYEVLVRCVEETLIDLDGVAYSRSFRQLDGSDGDDDEAQVDLTCVTFAILCNPAHDLTVSIQLRPEVFALHVNAQTFEVRRKRLEDIVEWTEKQCQRVEQLFRPNLKLQLNRFAGMPLRSEVSTAEVDNFQTIVKRQDGMATVFASILPFGFALTSEKTRIFGGWFRRDIDPVDIPVPPGPESMPLDED